MSQEADPINPSYYRQNGVEVAEAIEAWGLNFFLGNCVKYIARCGKKGIADPIEDLKKAEWYLKREIENRQKEKDRG